MTNNLHIPALLTISLITFGCEKHADSTAIPTPTPIILDAAPKTATNTFETKRLGKAIDQYVATPSAENAANVKKAFAELDGEIAELEARVAKTTGEDRAEAGGKLTNMQTYRAAETVRYTAATATAPVGQLTPVDTRTGAEKMGDGIEKAGDEVKDVTDKVGSTLKKGAENVEDKVKDATGN